MYYVLDRFWARHPGRWLGPYPRLEAKFNRGRRISEPVPNPIEIALEPYNDAVDDQGPEIPEYFKGRIPLFRQDLLDAMVAGGADNLEAFDVVLVDPDSGVRHATHKAVNIVGAISAADLSKSEATVHTGGPVVDVDFDRLVLDEKRAGNARIFRLAESVNAIMVHEALRDHLIASGFTKLEFLPPGQVAL